MDKLRSVVLVVEDEVLIRMDVCDQLAELGYEVKEAASGPEALAILDEGQPIDVVFTDVDMPGEPDGVALAGEVIANNRARAVLVTSGKLLVDPAALPDGVPFIPKPYYLPAVHAKIQALLEKAARSSG